MPLHTIEAAARKVRTGAPTVIMITGEPGIGKTALLRQAVDGLDGFRVLYAACDAAERSWAFEVVHQLVARVPAERLAGDPVLAASIAAHFGPAIVGGSMVRLLTGLQRDTPVALVIDDAHWADEASLDALGFVLRRLAEDRILVLVAGRTTGWSASPADPGTASQRWWRLGATHLPSLEIQLGGLPADDLAELAARLNRRPPDDRLATRLRSFTGGSPRYAAMVIAELSTRGDAAEWCAVPESLLSEVSAQLGELPEPSRRLVDAVAVLESRCRLGLAAQVAELADPVSALEPPLEKGLLRWWPAEPASPVQAAHPLLRAAVYQLIPPRRRASLHQVAAEVVDGHERWRHLAAAAAGVNPRLATELDAAATAALARGNVDWAASYLLLAADLSDDERERERRLLSATVHCLWWDHRHPAEQSRHAVEAAASSPLRSCALGLYAMRRGDVGYARERMTESAGLAAGSPAPAWLPVLASAALAVASVYQGDGRRAVGYASRALRHADEADRLTIIRAARCQVLGRAIVDGPRAALDDLSNLDTVLERAVGQRVGQGALLGERAVGRLLIGDLRAAADDARLALGQTDPGVAAPAELPLLVLAGTQYLLGEWTDASATVGRMLAARVQESHWLHDPIRAVGALLAAGQGAWETAEAHVRRMELAPNGSARQRHALWLAVARAGVARARRDHTAMVAAFGGVPELLARQGLSAPSLPRTLRSWWLPMLVEALVADGRTSDAEALLPELARAAEETPYLRIVLAWLSGRLAERRGQRRAAAALYENGIELPARDDVPLHRALLEQAYGEHLRAGGHRDAVAWLRRAQERYAAIGAGPFHDHCAKLAAKAGGPVKAVESADPNALTDREREVARLVAAGLTNHQAASRLYVSAKTVEYHLGNVYAKLGINSRRQLRDHPAVPNDARARP